MRGVAIGSSVLCLLMMISAPASSDPSAVDGEIDLPQEVIVQGHEGNGTIVVVMGSFTVTAKNGADQILRLGGSLSIAGDDWPATIEPSTFSDLTVGTPYEFSIVFTVPAGTASDTMTSYSVTLVLQNVLGNTQIADSFQATVEQRRDDGDGGGGVLDELRGDVEVPWGLLIFFGGLWVFMALGVVWAYRNLELVREVGGRRRIMMREKGSGRLLKGRYPPTR